MHRRPDHVHPGIYGRIRPYRRFSGSGRSEENVVLIEYRSEQRAATLDEIEAATAALHHLASTIATSALRLLGLDPFDVYARLAALAPIIDEIAAQAAAFAQDPLDTLPATSAPLVEILAEDHATWEVRLFAS